MILTRARSQGRRCRRRMTLAAIGILAPVLPMQCDGGSYYVGNTFASISCTSTGISWSAVTTDFVANQKIEYHWNIYLNGELWVRNGVSSAYYTNREGSHFRLPNRFPQAIDCDAGVYRIVIWTTRWQDTSLQTFPGEATTVCT